ncbi:MAG: hypothetical protein IT376_20785 [Polyangiaceae bacterium]|nr:hypothetical protein [Polyangiaceae bacterium]
MTARPALPFASVVAGGLALGCSSDEPRPPALREEADARVIVGCRELQEAERDGERLLLGGSAAGCVEGQQCPLQGARWEGACDGGAWTWADCAGEEWRWGCVGRDGGAEGG